MDSRWICKITDYGFKYLRHCSTSGGEERRQESFLWTAPELLRQRGTVDFKMADVFSFGIICQEVLTNSIPYGFDDEYSAEEIVKAVKSPPPKDLFRPTIPQGKFCS